MSVTTGAKRKEGGIGETIRVIIHALIIALVIRTFLFQPFNIPSGSLVPTLLVGDYLFVSKYSYGYSKHSIPFSPPLFSGRIWASEPKRGDIAVFKLPKDNSTDYIKRVIGLPGDHVQVVNGILQINGQPVVRERVSDYQTTDLFGRVQSVPMYRETLPGGTSHYIIEREGDRVDVPWGHNPRQRDHRTLPSRADKSLGHLEIPRFNSVLAGSAPKPSHSRNRSFTRNRGAKPVGAAFEHPASDR